MLSLSPTVLYNFITLNFQLRSPASETDLSMIFKIETMLNYNVFFLFKKRKEPLEKRKRKLLKRSGRRILWKLKQRENCKKEKKHFEKRKGTLKKKSEESATKKRKESQKKDEGNSEISKETLTPHSHHSFLIIFEHPFLSRHLTVSAVECLL